MTPRPEAVAAATWWAKQLSEPVRHDLGRGATDASELTNTASALVRRQHSQDEIDAFREALADEIEEHVAECGWRPDEPDFGSALRALAVDYGPDPVLADAAERAGFKLTMFDLPLKTVMWVNPGVVKVAEGHGAPITVVWGAE
ncbi:BTG family protein [Streptomyces murinus]|uniref:hypothetical protein n=1 Tax=Streptomyces murinus TaxID=33900 RepID=UPI000A1E70D8|nr:hypothetical protein [Streptomyces murinus]WDO09932.1 BTG family protein [Streptomyces murinus]